MSQTHCLRGLGAALVWVVCAGCGSMSSENARSSAEATSPTRATTGAKSVGTSDRVVDEAPASPTSGTSPTVVLEIASRDLEIDEAARQIRWRKDGGVKRGDYDEFLFAYDDYVATVGKANVEKDVRLEAACAAPTEAHVDPADAFSQRPQGGFLIRTHACRAVKATIE